ncbi:MBL fold metallo-hydrolase [Pseudonocardia humida]|uniref:MBL fold metallo-hydrolase n=1 Tax=Pseudonocardia humida TaxID=2800819 RepID=A0ABT1A2N1_9PSEU|nr:MBL fold metallo-hydrolase [Pseudonocardia humida]MCO1657216.1 MBL fold metallo-hydrolase [Pseudonocardia humida]
MDSWTEVADRVFVRRHRSLDLNVTLVVGDGACLVVDTRSDEVEGAELAAAVRTVTPHPWTVVNTHFHYDHAFGNAAFRPAPIWGHRRCVDVLAGPEGVAMRTRIAEHHRAAGREEEARRIEVAELVAPGAAVDGAATLDVGGRSVRLRHLGRGHTDSDLVVVVPDADLLVAGDLVEEGAPPQFGDGYPLDWPATMDALLELVEGPVVPGHGAVVDRGFVAGQRAELARLADVARAGHAEGRPAAETARELPYFGTFALQAVERAYLQLAAP